MDSAQRCAVPCFILVFLLHCGEAQGTSDTLPTFVKISPALVEFSNSSGTSLECSTGSTTTIQWFLKDGNRVTDVKGLRRVDENGNLIFPPFSAESFRQDVHATVYKCFATNTLGTIASHNIKVKAAVLQPYDIYVYDVYAMQGNTAVIRCHIPSFLTSYVNVTAWIRDSVVVIKSTQIDQNSKYSLMPTGELFVKDVDVKDGMTSFQCQTYNRLTGETVKSSTNGKLFVTETQGSVPPKIILSQKKVTVKRGQLAFMPCEVQANPAAEISWKIIGMLDKPLKKMDRHYLQISGSLIIQEVESTDNGTYRCFASNSAGEEYVDTDLIVTETLSVEMEFESLVVDAGKPAVLNCKPSGSPIQDLNWLKNGNPFSFNQKFEFDHGNTSIHATAATADDVGIYQCCVSNEFESACGSTALILGDVPPMITENFQPMINHPGEDVKVRCAAKGNPRPAFLWFLDDNELQNDERIKIEETINKSLIITELSIRKIRTEDGGLYKCVAENRAGVAYYWARINVYGNLGVRTVPPLIVVNGATAILNCPIYGYPIFDVKWERDELILPQEIRQMQYKNESLTISDIHRTEDSGLYICTAKSNKGIIVQGEIDVRVLVAPKLSPFSFQEELVQEGSRGRLQCVVVEGDIPLKIQWHKDDKVLPSDLGITVRDIDEFSSILTITAITPRHNGKYTCTAKNAAGIASFTTTLAVNVVPKITPFFFPENGVTEGILARVSCVVYQGDLPLEINWLRDGNVLTSDGRIVTKSIDDYSSILTIESVRKDDAGNYTCTARNSAATVSHTTNLLVNVPPKIVPFAFQDEHLVEGSLLRVSCVVSRGDLPLHITWQKDGLSVPDSVSVREFDSYSTVLSIDPVKREHSGNYTCNAKNQAGIATFSAELKVQVPSKWITQPQGQIVEKGRYAYLHCQADGYPKPKISWLFAKDEKESTRYPIHNNAETIIKSNGTLILKNVNKSKEGRYICLASNGIGRSLSAIVLVSVLAPPTFKLKSQTVNEKIGNNARFECAPSGDTPINMSWSYNNNLLNKLNAKFKLEDRNNSSVLTIQKITREESAKYRCEAENSFGKDHTEFVLVVQEPPEVPILSSEIKIGNRSVHISWNEPFDGNSRITHYIVQYKKQVDNWQLKKYNETVDGSQTSVIIVNLQPATMYVFRVAAMNKIGIGKFSTEVAKMTDTAIPTGTAQNIEVESIDGNTLRISWKAPRKDTWNGPIRGYNIGFRVEGSNEPFEFSALEVPEDYTEDLIYQITKLKKYTVYAVVIQVYNDKGVGPLSEPEVVMTSEDVPSIAPEGLRCSALSSKSIYVLWDALPADSINGILRSYKVFYKSTAEWYNSPTEFKESDKEKITLQNLDVNTNYSIVVLANTKVGDGVKSDAVYCKTHEDVPDRPNEIKVLSSSSDSVVVAWKPPRRINGDLIRYNVYYRPLSESEEIGTDGILKTEQSKMNNVHAFQSDMEYFEVKGLRKNQKYAFWVSATSAIGEGQHSDVIAQSVAKSAVSATSASFDDAINTPWKKDITLPCRAVGIPTPQRKWTIDHKPLPIDGRKVLLSDGTLLINKVDAQDSGNYTCMIYNTHGKDQVQYSLNVQVPPSSPILDIISKTRSSIQLQWKQGTNGGDGIKGYILHYRRDGGEWETIELAADKEIFTITNLACGVNYQMFMEAYNKVGKGLPCDVIQTSTEGSEITIPTNDQLLHEGSTYVSVHLESWPITSCPVQSFQVEYKSLHADEWTTVSSSIRPTQRKLVIPGLVPATWYALRVTAITNGDPVPAEYKFATRTVNGATIPPPDIKMEKPKPPVYIFYLDPYIFIPAVALLIVVIIASAVLCVYMKRKNGSVGTPSDYGTVDTWPGNAPSSYTASTLYATIPHHKKRNDPNPYASGRVDFFPDSDAWIETRTLTRGIPREGIQGVRVLPPRTCEQQTLNRSSQGFQETTFAFGTRDGNHPNSDYDQPPKGM